MPRPSIWLSYKLKKFNPALARDDADEDAQILIECLGSEEVERLLHSPCFPAALAIVIEEYGICPNYQSIS